MKKFLFDLFESSGQIDITGIFYRMIAALAVAIFIFLSYKISHSGTIYSKKFNVSLMVLVLVTGSVMIVIGNNIALSLGMVGALSIVRFRTAIKDSRDAVYIFWAIVAGISCGAGDYAVAAIGSTFIFIVLLFFGRIKNDDKMLIIIRTTRMNEEKIEALVFKYFFRKAELRVKNTTDSTVEFIYEISRKMLDKAQESKESDLRGKRFIDAIYEIGNVDYCNVVMQNDEIGS